MLPLTLGHLVVLSRIESPFADATIDPALIGVGDLAVALWVCSRPAVTAWNQFGSGRGRLSRWWIGLKVEARFTQLLDAFVSWMSIQRAGPDVWQSGGGSGAQRGAPALLVLLVTLVRKFGFTYREAFELTMAEAVWLHWASLEDDGLVQLMTDTEREAAEEAQRVSHDPAALADLERMFAEALPKRKEATA